MPDLANYSFLPWVRMGLGNEIIEVDSLGAALPGNPVLERPEISVSATLKGTQGDQSKESTITKTVKVQGPGDVLGVNPQSIIRVHPKNGVANFETNNLCYIEFYEEDLPWRFTPARPNGEKLRPWLALIVLRENEFEKSKGGTPTPYITITNEALSKVFCNTEDTYALAHVQVLEEIENNSPNLNSYLADLIAKDPDSALSRLLCARKLEYTDPSPGLDYDPNRYHAFLIPAFETGRRAGLNLDTHEVPAQQSSWSNHAITEGTNPNDYPYYFTWNFKVDQGGDFESLAQLLEARELPENIGKREMLLDDMGYGIMPVGDDALGFVEGAMRHPNYQTAAWPMTNLALKQQLLEVLNLSFNLQSTTVSDNSAFFFTPNREEDPIITPPIYGKWHKGIDKLTNNGTDWVHKLNLHPSNRVAAGLGVQVVQKHQEKFMELAWEQIGEINEANQKIRENELAKRASKALFSKKIQKFDHLNLILATGKSFEMIKFQANATIKKVLKTSTVPTSIRSGTFLKVANNFTPTALMNGGVDGAKAVLNQELFVKMNKAEGEIGKISAAPPKGEPLMSISSTKTFELINQVVTNPPKSFMERFTTVVIAVGPMVNNTDLFLPALQAEFTKTAEYERAVAIVNSFKKAGSRKVIQANKAWEFLVENDVFEGRISDDFDEGIYGTVKAVNSDFQFEKQILFKKKSASTNSTLIQFQQVEMLKSRIEYSNSFSTVFNINAATDPAAFKVLTRPIKPVLEATFVATLRSKLDPKVNFKRKLGAFFKGAVPENHKPIMAYPRFPFPVYHYLKEISPDYIIPNVSEIEPNTITLMEPNWKFVESFLVGMNHEFSRELLWREFPTDMRGSYFRHFWDYENNPNVGSVAELSELIENQDKCADIEKIHLWNSSLGNNQAKKGIGLVLLIKGDLLRKYPNTLVYAQKAVYQNDNSALPRKLSDYDDLQNVKWPVLSGTLEPDVYFFGFELTPEEANGNRTGDPGWFFVLRERPAQISFGLDDAAETLPSLNSWDDLAWQHITNDINQYPPYLQVKGKLQVNGNSIGLGSPKVKWNASSSDMAFILYQSPILFARHASTMLTE